MGSTRQVALLRGINVGGHNRVEMSRLRALMEDLGHGDVRTHLQSGNVVFTSDLSPERVAQGLEVALAERLGVRVRVLVRTRDELAAVVAGNALVAEATDPARLIVLFLSAAPDPERLSGIDHATLAPERLQVAGREIHLWCANGVRDAQVIQLLSERRLGVTVTARNWNTVTRLLELCDA
jgi:uncharacterized protein (DUF1697 family)